MSKLGGKLAKGLAEGKLKSALSALKALKKSPAQIEKEETEAKHRAVCDEYD